MSRRAYPKYKPSGVEWLGHIPAHWEVRKLKYLVDLLTQKVDSDETKLGLENIESGTSRYLETESEFDGDGVSFKAGDVLYGKLRPYLAKVLLAKWEGLAVGDFFVLSPHDDIEPKYLQYRLLEPIFTDLSDGSTFGAKMPRVSWDFMGDLKFSLPDVSEQEGIAGFLDRETGRIDALIEKKRRQIELLKEKRAALISHAVTKGLDPNAPMKDSGIDWLGPIPAHWDVKQLRNASFKIATGRTPDCRENDYFQDGDYPWFTPGDFTGAKVLNEAARKVTYSAITDAQIQEFPKGSVMMVCIGATIGKVAVSGLAASCNQQINVICPNESNDAYFMAYYLMTLKEYIVRCGKYTTLPIMNQDDTKNLPYLAPLLSEQQVIVAHLDRETERIDKLVEKIDNSIGLLREYRTALISAAVTGKINVRKEVI